MQREIAVSIGNADDKYCNDCRKLFYKIMRGKTRYFCDAFIVKGYCWKKVELQADETDYILRCQECLEAELRKGEG